MTKTIIIIASLTLAACTTPQTVLKNPKTGQIVECGGNVSSSLAGGIIGYHIQKANDEKCVSNHLKFGFEAVEQ